MQEMKIGTAIRTGSAKTGGITRERMMGRRIKTGMKITTGTANTVTEMTTASSTGRKLIGKVSAAWVLVMGASSGGKAAIPLKIGTIF